MDIETTLKSYGLNDKEIKVYLALIDLGLSKVQDIAVKSAIVRETTYSILKSLIEKNLASFVIKGDTRYYAATSPDTFMELLKEKERSLAEIIPLIKERQKLGYKRTIVNTYEGKEGIKTVFKEIIKEKHQDIYGILNSKQAKILLYYYPERISEERAEKNIKSHMLMDNSQETKKMIKDDKKYYRETRESEIVNSLNTGTYLFGDKTAFITFDQQEPVGIIIENKAITQTIKKIHEKLWKEAKKQ